MSNNDDRHMEDAPPASGPSTRLTISIEPEAAQMLNELACRLYPGRRPGGARALVIEQGIRMLHRRVMGAANSTHTT